MEVRLVDCLASTINETVIHKAVDVIKLAKIIVRSANGKTSTERIMILKVIMILLQRDNIEELLTRNVISGLQALIDAGLVGQVADEIKVSKYRCECF